MKLGEKKFHKDWTKNADFLLMAKFWMCPIFYSSDFRINNYLFWITLWRMQDLFYNHCAHPNFQILYWTLYFYIKSFYFSLKISLNKRLFVNYIIIFLASICCIANVHTSITDKLRHLSVPTIIRYSFWCFKIML